MKFGKNNFILYIVRVIFNLFFFVAYQYRVTGKEKIPKGGNCVVVMKHQSWVDTLAAATLTPVPAYFMAKFELFDNLFGDFPGTVLFTVGKIISPFTRWLLYRLGVIPIDRENPSKMISSFKFMKTILQQGEYLIFYPEGRVIRDKMGEFKSGLIKMVQRFQKKADKRIRFIPVGVSYGKKGFFRKKMTVKIGDPLEFEWNEKNASDVLKDKIEKLTDFNL